jgi:hypothetical protein
MRASVRSSSWLGACFTVALIALLVMGEIGRIIGDVSVAGATYSASSLYSVPGVWNSGTALHQWALASCSGIPIKAWFIWLL